jgi:hypothetical protein
MTNKKIARTTKSRKRPTKSRKEQPLPEGLVERAAERAGVKPTAPYLTHEDEAALSSLQGVTGRPPSRVVLETLKACRESNFTNDAVRYHLVREATDMQHVAERLTPGPVARDRMLVDALEVIERALTTFESEGCSMDTALGIALEGLRCAADDFDLFMDASSAPCKVDSMAFLRASERAKLALSLAAFREKHPEWRPTKAADEGEQAEQAAGGAA